MVACNLKASYVSILTIENYVQIEQLF